MHDLTGKVFGRLTAINRSTAVKPGNKVRWNCRCLCGEMTIVITDKLMSGTTTSCGCYQQERRGKAQITHGGTRGPRSGWDPRAKMLYAAKARAKYANVPFSISINDIVIPVQCPILGITLVRNAPQCRPDSPSLDRIIPSKGYVAGNVQVISHKANTMKSDASLEELRKLVSYLESR